MGSGLRSMSQTRENILKLLWKMENPVTLKEISEKIGLKIRSANMHLLRLKMAGYVSKTEDGYYTITEPGKEIIGFPKVDENLAKRILSKTPPEKAFHFYTEIGQPLGVSSDNLIDFCDKIKSVDVRSVEFHMARGDFELWVHFLGDAELAKRIRLIREMSLTGESLRDRIYKILKSKSDELLRKVV